MTGDVEIRPGIWLRYGCEGAKLGGSIRGRFVPLSIDAPTRAFVDAALADPAGPLRTRLFQATRRFLSDYDAYGLLGMYGMHLLTKQQVSALLPLGEAQSLLDVGAGNGAITDVLAPSFERVQATETSRVLRRRLAQRGYSVLNADLSVAADPTQRFDVIACLNVLDRCARPRSLLTHLKTMLEPGGRLLLSVPLPLRPHVHVGPHTVDAEESLPRSDHVWELDATSLHDDLLRPLGFTVERLARVPYLSRGDADCPLYVLDAAVYVLSAAPNM